ncbi:hypothetical protein [Glycomyces buryatensis]|uniref:DUF4853 domain-containing protein n=1 Tax=Glycomyces buryatensis TaxID=2570927 RepID=A0A4S8Q927_9ACTN|nr:hypothetical protein [Glycomyces buryatensis]THV40818.1 hypothetical protein FAB82_14315 [Glycomyces buryatensis]
MPFPRSSANGAKLIGAATAALALAACTTSGSSINEDYTDNEALAEMEAFVADSIEPLEDFPGFERRIVKVIECLYGMNEEHTEEGYDVVSLEYEFPEANWEDPLVRETYPEQLARLWGDQGHEVEVDHDDGAIGRVTAKRDDGFTMNYNVQGVVWMNVHLTGDDCVAIADGELEIPEPQGGVTGEDNDILSGYGPRVD